MMKAKTVLIILVLTGIVVSCIPSLYPLYNLKDLILNPKIEGIFQDEDDSYWQIERINLEWEQKLSSNWDSYTSGKTYKLIVREENRVQDFAMHLLKLGDDFYMDFYPVNFNIPHKLLNQQLLPVHIFAKTEVTNDHLILHFFEYEWLSDLIEDQQIKVSHMELPDRTLLTARTDELQKFIIKYANDSTTFMEADTLLRKPV